MPEYRAGDFDRHEGRRTEFWLNASILQPHILSDLSNVSRMVRQGSLGLRRWKYVHRIAARTKGTLKAQVLAPLSSSIDQRHSARPLGSHPFVPLRIADKGRSRCGSLCGRLPNNAQKSVIFRMDRNSIICHSAYPRSANAI
jgi:hypothetical protein